LKKPDHICENLWAYQAPEAAVFRFLLAWRKNGDEKGNRNRNRKGKRIAYAIVLGPAAFFSLALLLVVELGSRVIKSFQAKLSDLHAVELCKDLTGHGAFYGSAFAGFLGNETALWCTTSFQRYVLCFVLA